MKNIIIVSATSGTNLILSNDILNLLDQKKFKAKILNVGEIKLPLFNPQTIDEDSKKYKRKIKSITDDFIWSNGIIICAPEYNGNVPPVLSNAIAWISVTTSYWKDGFRNKLCLIASSSGGGGERYVQSMHSQLIHLGAKVFEEKIIINSSNKSINIKQKNDLKDFLSLL